MKDLEQKVILLTGATDGIGKAAATNLAGRGASLTIVGRNRAKTGQVLAELKACSGNPNLEMIICDLSRNAEVRRAAEEFKSRHDRLDVLINNAGAVFKSPELGPDDLELAFALNHLAGFQLTTLLLDLIRSTPGARVVSTSSAMHARGKLDLQKTPASLEGSGTLAYATSKLAIILFTRELQRRLNGTTAIANCFEPGNVKSKFGAYGGADLGWVNNLIYKIGALFAITPEEGADSLIWLATSPEAGALRGEYVSKRRPITPSNQQATDMKLAEQLWELSEKLCQEIAARTVQE